MDEFGVLVESMGFKSQKSAPMAHLKPKPKNNFSFNNGFPQSSSNSSKSTLWNESFVDDLDGIFQSKNNNNDAQKSQKYFDAGVDIFGGSFSNTKPSQPGSQGSIDLDSVFDFNTNSRTTSRSKLYDVMLSTKSDAADDLLDGFGFNTGNSKKVGQGNLYQMDDLIPGFGESSSSSNVSGNNGIQAGGNGSQPSRGDSSNSTFSMAADDPFSVFEASKSATNDSSRSFSHPSEKNTERTFVESSIDELEKFAMGKVPDSVAEKPSVAKLGEIRISLNKKDSKARDDSGVRKVHRPEEFLKEKQREKDRDKVASKKNSTLVNDSIPDNIFDMDNDSGHVNRPRTQTKDPILDALFNDNPGLKVHKAASQAPYTKEKSSSVRVVVDDFPSLFGEAPSSSGPFQEIEGESEERRRARWNHHMRTQRRMAQALAEKNERDFQTQYEQEERRRLAETLDYDIKRWSAGKEGNLLALLSSLQDVLWPECGWQPVSLTDLIAPTSVKKVYHKATLCVHPDKVQQKGSTLQQKYIAEKVFDLLKEAWNKHNTQGPQSSLNMNF